MIIGKLKKPIFYRNPKSQPYMKPQQGTRHFLKNDLRESENAISVSVMKMPICPGNQKCRGDGHCVKEGYVARRQSL